MGKKVIVVFITIVLLSFFSLNAFAETIYEDPIIEKAKVLEVEITDNLGMDAEFFLEKFFVKLEILSGEHKGLQIETIHGITGSIGYDIIVEPGDKVLVTIESDNGDIEVFISEHVREDYIKIVMGLFVILLIIVGGLKGLKTILTLILTLGLILKVLLPGLLAGYSPILLTILVSIIITVVTILVVGGVNKKSYSAIVGVLGSVLIAGLIAYVVGTKSKLTGLSSQEAMMLMYIPQGIQFNFSGLLFAGIIMGALGAVMDVGMSIASAIEEVSKANPLLTTKELIKSGMNVGRDIMGTMANTLILAYMGSAIPLLLLFTAYKEPYMRVINLDIISTEIIRAFAGSIGLVLCVPLTAVIAGVLIKNNTVEKKDKEHEEIG